MTGEREQRAIKALRTPDPSLANVPNTVRQALAEVIEEQITQLVGLRAGMAGIRAEIEGWEYWPTFPGYDLQSDPVERLLQRVLAHAGEGSSTAGHFMLTACALAATLKADDDGHDVSEGRIAELETELVFQWQTYRDTITTEDPANG